jgi:tetratricopeptide (TPR) repeat protein/predicted Ser/Thr protein kinase
MEPATETACKEMTLAPGSSLGPYKILEPIGAGGMGEVYRALDPQLRRDVAIKVLPQDVSAEEERLTRFENEARLASSLNHPNIVTIYSLGWEGRRRYIAMEFIDGLTLQELVEKGPMPVDQALAVATQVADGLAKAHEAGIIHRDLKPKNVMLTKDGHAKILDFGLSKLAHARVDSEAPTAMFADPKESLTQPGTILGTVEYMSPEQAAGRPADFRSDQFSMGSLMYAVLTGSRPFHGESAVQTLTRIIEEEPRPVNEINPRVPPSFQVVIERCMRKDPRDRYASTRELTHALRQVELVGKTPPRPWAWREWIRACIVVAILLAIAGGLWMWARQPYRPKAAALDWYEKGSAAMHSMTFETARRAFEQAVAADPKFALAHASLARAYDELDYSERAKEWMLRAMAVAQETRLSGADQTRLRALQCLVSRDYGRAAPLLRKLEDNAGAREKPAAALESGWLAQQREDTAGAAAAYERALKINPGYAAAKLRLGYIQQRRGENEQALKSFSEAESLYNAASDYEGITEALYQQANLLNRRSRAAEALPFIEKAMSVARAAGNRYQEIRLQLLESVAARRLDENARARELAQQAIDAAVAENMDNLATSGMIALGNSFLVGNDLEAAEAHFRRALDLARRGKVRRYEALASLSLASVFEQRNHPEEARRFIEAALPFDRQAGYRREVVQCMVILGGALHQLGELEEGVKVLREALPSTVQLQDTGTEVRLRERLAEVLQDQGAWPEALQESERAVNLVGSGTESTWARLNCSGLYWRLGRRQDAERSMAVVEKLLKNEGKAQLRSIFNLRQAEIAYADGRFETAKTNARMAISAAHATGDSTALGAALIAALASLRASRSRAAVQAANDIIQRFEQAKLAGNAASARLSTAEALVAAGNHDLARKMALESLDFFERRRIWESLWRGQLVAAQVSNETSEIQAHQNSARSAFAQLRKLWPEEDVDSYLRRPDIKRLSSGMRF